MVDVSCYDGAKGTVTKVAVDPAPFGEKVRKRLVRQAFLHYAAAHRLGTHSTLTRAGVNFSERKPWRQKGTGRARAGDFSSPVWRKGGVAHGPHPRKYKTDLSRRMRREALRSALLGKLQDGELHLVDGLHFEKPCTKDALKVLESLGTADRRTQLVIAERGENLFRSFRNLPRVAVTMASELNVEDILLHERLILEKKALEQLVARLGDA